jgi:ABC-type Fe3+ transport system permease subunit
MNVIRRKWQGLPRGIVVVITALVIYIPLLFIVVQSFLSAPFFARSKEFSLGAFEFIFTDPDFYLALKSGFILAVGLVLIAIPLGGILAFLMVRTDLPGRRFIEPLILVPIFVSRWYWRLAMWSPPGRSVFLAMGRATAGVCAVEYLLDVQHCGDCRADPRSACLSLYLVRAA